MYRDKVNDNRDTSERKSDYADTRGRERNSLESMQRQVNAYRYTTKNESGGRVCARE